MLDAVCRCSGRASVPSSTAASRIFHRLAYSATTLGYLSTGLSVIVLNLVPVLTILFGYFPIALNLWTVIGITAYYSALNALSYYCLSWSHYKVRHRVWSLFRSGGADGSLRVRASVYCPARKRVGGPLGPQCYSMLRLVHVKAVIWRSQARRNSLVAVSVSLLKSQAARLRTCACTKTLSLSV